MQRQVMTENNNEGLKDVSFELATAGFGGDNMTITSYGGQVRICIEEPWAGSTETGFGYECSTYLNRAQLTAVRDVINEILGEPLPFPTLSA